MVRKDSGLQTLSGVGGGGGGGFGRLVHIVEEAFGGTLTNASLGASRVAPLPNFEARKFSFKNNLRYIFILIYIFLLQDRMMN